MTEIPKAPVASWKPIAGLLTAGFFLHALLVPFRTCMFSADEPRYIAEAYNIHVYGVLSYFPVPNPLPTAMDTPLFPLFLSGLLAICGSVKAALLTLDYLNALFFMIAALGVYRLVINLGRNAATALVATALFLLYPESFGDAILRMPDGMFMAWLVWGATFFAGYLNTRNWRLLTAASVFWAASVLTKPIGLYLGLVCLVVVLVVAYRGAVNPWRAVLASVVAAAAGPLLICPWIVRNYRDFHLIGVSSIVDSNPYRWNYPVLLEAMGNKDPDAVIRAGIERVHRENPASLTNEMLESRLEGQIARKELSAHWAKYLIATARQHPMEYVRTGIGVTYRYLCSNDPSSDSIYSQGPAAWHGEKNDTPGAWRSMPWEWKGIEALSLLFLGAVYLCVVAGFLGLIKERQWKTLVLLVVALLYFAAAVGPLANPRYRLPMDPFFSTAAAVGLVAFQKKRSLRGGSLARPSKATAQEVSI